MRLIDAGAILKRAEESFKNAGLHGEDYRKFKKWLRKAPTIDAVEVVRCGECKHMMADGRCMEFADDGIRPSASDFCSYGERREDSEA